MDFTNEHFLIGLLTGYVIGFVLSCVSLLYLARWNKKRVRKQMTLAFGLDEMPS